MYSDKIKHFLDYLFDDQNEGKPLMQKYYQRYFDMYWDLHLGVRAETSPQVFMHIKFCDCSNAKAACAM
jgi:hypothetical protein